MSFNAINHLVNNWGQGIEDQIPEHWFEETNKKEFRVLEVGFGKGSLLKRLSNVNGPELYGIECSQQNYRHALDVMKVKANLILSDISLERFPYVDGHFDVVVMLEVLEHVLSPMHAILEIQRVLRKDGIFMFSWPEERLISGIGMEEDQSKRQHGPGYHSFPYPGLFRYDNMRVFFEQMYFKIEEEIRREYHVFWKMRNTKKDAPNILDVVNGDYDRKTLYNDIETESKFKDLVPYLNRS
jgi:SAM-dependent methyltransferase